MKNINTEAQRQALGVAIKARRQAKNLSQQGLADLLHTKQQRIAELEVGKSKDIDLYFSCLVMLGGTLKISWGKGNSFASMLQ